MFGLGMTELLVILGIALLVIGPKRLPEVAKALGRGFAEFKKATQEVRDTLDKELHTRDFSEAVRDVKNELSSTISSAADLAPDKAPDNAPPGPPKPPETVAPDVKDQSGDKG